MSSSAVIGSLLGAILVAVIVVTLLRRKPKREERWKCNTKDGICSSGSCAPGNKECLAEYPHNSLDACKRNCKRDVLNRFACGLGGACTTVECQRDNERCLAEYPHDVDPDIDMIEQCRETCYAERFGCGDGKCKKHLCPKGDEECLHRYPFSSMRECEEQGRCDVRKVKRWRCFNGNCESRECDSDDNICMSAYPYDLKKDCLEECDKSPKPVDRFRCMGVDKGCQRVQCSPDDKQCLADNPYGSSGECENECRGKHVTRYQCKIVRDATGRSAANCDNKVKCWTKDSKCMNSTYAKKSECQIKCKAPLARGEFVPTFAQARTRPRIFSNHL